MCEILLTTLNARYAHASFGLRYLLANLGPLQPRAKIVEFEIGQRTVDVLEAILQHNPRIVGLGVYIWNIDQATQLVGELKRVRPDIVVVLGGPEVSYETEEQAIAALADYVVTGEADLTFSRLCAELLSGARPTGKIIPAELPQFSKLRLPYDLYDDRDVAQRVIYVEASRGCPYECEFCLSSLDIPVRQADLETFLAAMGRLLDRGVKQFKFVDRTFNLNVRVSRAILEFFLERTRGDDNRLEDRGIFLHFEMIPDRLPDSLRELIQQFPPGALQFEVGIQTFNPEVAARISRRQDVPQTEANLRWLRDQTFVHVHADLIVGLPGEDLASFGAGFDRLVALGPQEIQVGVLKRLRGTPIVRHDAEWEMVYSPHAPYEVLQTKSLSFVELQRLRRFSRYWDLVANSGNFVESAPLLWSSTADSVPSSPFGEFLKFSDWLWTASGQTQGIALKRLAERLFEYLTTIRGLDPTTTARALFSDYQGGGRSDLPEFLRPHLPDVQVRRDHLGRSAAPPRQQRHLRARAEE